MILLYKYIYVKWFNGKLATEIKKKNISWIYCDLKEFHKKAAVKMFLNKAVEDKCIKIVSRQLILHYYTVLLFILFMEVLNSNGIK